MGVNVAWIVFSSEAEGPVVLPEAHGDVQKREGSTQRNGDWVLVSAQEGKQEQRQMHESESDLLK